MLKKAILCFAAVASLGSVAAAEAALLGRTTAAEMAGWAQMRPGMSTRETAAILGQPILRSGAKGFELWIYSGGAEVLFHQGPVRAWTAPTAAPKATAATAKTYSHDVYFLPGRPMPKPGNGSRRATNSAAGYSLEEILRFRGR
jgi:hypothetical protein